MVKWDTKTVDSLNEFQQKAVIGQIMAHEFTCPNSCADRTLRATENGWVCPSCNYTQDWYNSSMLTPEVFPKSFLESFKDK